MSEYNKKKLAEEAVPVLNTNAKVDDLSQSQAVMKFITSIAKDGIRDIVKPAVNDILYDFASEILAGVIYKDDSSRGRGRRSSGGRAYNDISSGKKRPSSSTGSSVLSRSTDSRYVHREISFDTKYQARELIISLREWGEPYGWVKVSDMLHANNMASEVRSTDTTHGWTIEEFSRAREKQRLDGRWIIDLPPARSMQ